MATYLELIYDIKNTIKQGIWSDDLSLSDEQILHWYNIERSRLVKEDLIKRKAISPILIQHLNCVLLECSQDECCNIGLRVSGNNVLRTVDKIPDPVTVYWSDIVNPVLITYVGTVDGKKPFEFTSESIVNWSRYNRYRQKYPKSYYRDNRMYIDNITGIEIMRIDGVFVDPLKIEELKNANCEQGNCLTLDVEYPIQDYLLSALKTAVMQNHLGPFMTLSNRDYLNNDKDNENKTVQNQS